ncbi:MAG: cbb3-type cytochrome c oxidase subunit II [Verrucomicrobiae bacterium]|nr:cbb3-type cytochrome c oxidase subunit II [Verrucomicrobiae bacterium]MCP5540119.1 cbb3-type cytochrome c oxidase subunit II [Akkermansiaceae bacterium]
MKSTLWKNLAGLGVAFGLPWLLLIVVPYLRQANAEPVAYAPADAMPAGAVYPDPANARFGSSDRGAAVYAREGCAYCHTQVVRPTYAGADMWRAGWAGREGEGLARETRPGDYAGEKVALLGYQRIGQDLANVGSRISSREEMHRHLHDPKSFVLHSVMPAYRHLYKEGPNGKPTPTPDAEALVDYLMSRKKDAKLPGDAPAPAPAN